MAELGTVQPPRVPLNIINCQEMCFQLCLERCFLSMFQTFGKLSPVFPLNPFSSWWTSKRGEIPPHSYHYCGRAVSLQKCSD